MFSKPIICSLHKPVGCMSRYGGGPIQQLLGAWEDAAGVSQLQVSGQGTPTHTHTSTIYAPDHEGIYREFETDEVVWRDGRVVENILKYSDDFSNAVWSQASLININQVEDPIGGFTATTLQSTTGAAATNQLVIITDYTNDYISSMWVRRRSGTGPIHFYRPDASAVVITDLLSDGEWHRVALSSKGRDTYRAYLQIRISDPNESLDIWHPQIENTTGRSDTTTPSEYIKTEATPVQKVFPTTNGNSVTNNIVTEADGVPLDPPPSIVAQGEATNLVLQSSQEASQNVTVAVGKYTLTVFGTGATATISAGTATGTGFGQAIPGSGVEVDITAGGTVAVVGTGSPDWIQLLNMPLKQAALIGPITTSGSAVTTDPNPTVYDGTNLNNDACAFYAEVYPQDGLIAGTFLGYGMGANVYLNSTFEDTSNWGITTSGWVISDGKASGVNPGSGFLYQYPSTTVVGQNVLLFFNIVEAGTPSNRVEISFSDGVTDGSTYYDVGYYTIKGEVTINNYIYLKSLNFSGSIDNVTARVLGANTDFSLTDLAGNSISKAGTADQVNQVAAVWHAEEGKMCLYVDSTTPSADATYGGTMFSGDLEMYKAIVGGAYFRKVETFKGGTYAQLNAKAVELLT